MSNKNDIFINSYAPFNEFKNTLNDVQNRKTQEKGNTPSRIECVFSEIFTRRKTILKGHRQHSIQDKQTKYICRLFPCSYCLFSLFFFSLAAERTIWDMDRKVWD